MSMYNSIEYSDNYSKLSGSLWQCYRDKPNVVIRNSGSIKSKAKITGTPPDYGNTKDAGIALSTIIKILK